MVAFDLFRQNLATALLDCADRRRSSFAAGQATGEDIRVIALLESMAGDVKNLDLHVFLIFELMFTHEHLARRFLRRHERLLVQIGVSYHPTSATDLVRWLTRQALDDDRQDRSPSAKRPATLALSPPSGTWRLRGKAAATGFRGDLLVFIASDFCAGFGVVAPMLAVWEVGQSVKQWLERAIVGSHTAVPATIVSSEPTAAIRTTSLSTTVVLGFRPSGSPTLCQAPVRIEGFAGRPVVGTTMMVVPQSTACEAPLIPSEIGEPLQTFALATALMASGLVCIKLQAWLSRRLPRLTFGKSRCWAGERRYDLA